MPLVRQRLKKQRQKDRRDDQFNGASEMDFMTVVDPDGNVVVQDGVIIEPDQEKTNALESVV